MAQLTSLIKYFKDFSSLFRNFLHFQLNLRTYTNNKRISLLSSEEYENFLENSRNIKKFPEKIGVPKHFRKKVKKLYIFYVNGSNLQ